MKYVVIVNGKPGSGKTTFEEMCRDYIDSTECAWYHQLSSIDFIKNIYKMMGWDGDKTDKARKDLSTLKQMWISLNDGPTAYILNEVVVNIKQDEDHIIFVDVREESEIIKLVEAFNILKPLGIKCTTLFISRKDTDGIEHGNKSDDNVGKNMSLYLYKIHNDGNIRDLKATAKLFINQLQKEENNNGKEN